MALNDYAELKRRIKDSGLLAKQPWFYAKMIALSFALLAASLALLVVAGNLWLQMVGAAVLSIAFVQFAFIAHDAGHRQVSTKARINDLLGLVVNLILGVSRTWWVQKHNIHHSYPNLLDTDPDLNIPALAFSEEQVADRKGLYRLIVKYQSVFFLPLLTLEGVGLRLASAQFLLRERAKFSILEPLLSVVHVAIYVGFTVYFLGVWPAILFAAVHHALTGLYLGSVFAPNHKGMLVLTDKQQADFLQRQVLTSRNIKAHAATDYLYGGQNFQIEHHLFPSMPRNNLRAAQTIVRRFCAERGLPYKETTMIGSYREILLHLHEVSAPLRNRASGPSDLSRASGDPSA